jgi:hypothetical protein
VGFEVFTAVIMKNAVLWKVGLVKTDVSRMVEEGGENLKNCSKRADTVASRQAFPMVSPRSVV